MKEKLDYIVIGQGIAGTTIAWWLNFNKKQFYILNDEKKNTSSSAALGIYKGGYFLDSKHNIQKSGNGKFA